MTSLLTLLLLASAQSSYRAQYPLPGLTVPAGWGVNIHFTRTSESTTRQLRESGFKWIRKDLYWKEVEKERGVFDFSRYDSLMNTLAQAGVRAMLILDYGNPLYREGPPRTSSERVAFLRYVRAAVQRYKGRGVVWEMWNEPNLDQYWQPRVDVREYVALAKAVGQTIRQIAPAEWYVGLASNHFDWRFLEGCFAGGLLETFDGVTVHPYRRSDPPETVLADWQRLWSLIGRYKPAGRPVVMISGEWGYSELYPGMNERLQAIYAPRQYLSNLLAGVPMSIWYDWEDGPNANDKEHRFGVTRLRGAEKLTYKQVRHLSSMLAGYAYKGRVPLGSGADYLLLFQRGRSNRYALWTTASDRQIDLPLPPGTYTLSRPGFKATFRDSSDDRVKVTHEVCILTRQG
ncbi:MAG: cellulase family glycosylhydrolase [Fimbriimonas sp.]